MTVNPQHKNGMTVESENRWQILLKINLLLLSASITGGIVFFTFLTMGHFSQNERIAIQEYRQGRDEQLYSRVKVQLDGLDSKLENLDGKFSITPTDVLAEVRRVLEEMRNLEPVDD